MSRLGSDLLSPDLRVENRSRSAFPDRSAAELRASFEELSDMVASFRAWNSAVSWLSPRWSVARHEREAVGLDGEQFEWARLLVIEYRDGRFASLCDFDLEDEDAAFAYAEERMRATSSRLAVSNRASEAADDLIEGDAGPRHRRHPRFLLGPLCVSTIAANER